MSGKRLTPGDIAAAARTYDLTPAHIRAVLAVESAGRGFAEDGRPTVRFEPHWFQRLTEHRFDSSHPFLSHAYSLRRNFPQPARQSDRWAEQLDVALALDRDAAIQAASWGLGQLMGFNHRRCGFSTPQAFLNAHWRSEAGQLDAMLRFIANAGLMDELRDRKWAAFAYGYNGPDFASNRYDRKLADAFRTAA